MVVFVNAHRSRAQVKVRVGGIVGSESGIFHAINVCGGFSYVLSGQEIRMIIGAHVARADLFGVDVVDASFGDVNVNVTIDAHVSFY